MKARRVNIDICLMVRMNARKDAHWIPERARTDAHRIPKT
jgi:hypothetical protein